MVPPTLPAFSIRHHFVRKREIHPSLLRWMTTLPKSVTPDRYSTFHMRHYASSPTTSNNISAITSSFQSMQMLAAKLRESRPLRSTSPLSIQQGSNEGTTATKRTTLTERNQLGGELALHLCTEYRRLPSLRLPLLDDCERGKILLYLALDCIPNHQDVAKAVQRYETTRTVSSTVTYSGLRKAATPHYEHVLEYILQQNACHGMSFLVPLREDLLQVIAWMKSTPEHDKRLPQLIDLDRYLQNLFCSWFSPGMIEVKRITYENTSASIIERISTKEAVHPLQSLEDLRRRLGPDRRVFSFFHPLLPDEPLVFVHVALKADIPSSMEQIRAPSSQEEMRNPRVATFYSISNSQPALAGVGLASLLLKDCIGMLQEEFPNLERFVTLSPIPRFRKWLEAKIYQNENHDGSFFDDSLLSEEDISSLTIAGLFTNAPANPQEAHAMFLELLRDAQVSSNDADNSDDAAGKAIILQNVLTKLAARYLVIEKHRGKPLDGVARFHISNGAEVFRINYAADLSRKGIQNSFGMMVNYHYNLSALTNNRQKYELDYSVSTAQAVLDLLGSANSSGDARSKL